MYQSRIKYFCPGAKECGQLILQCNQFANATLAPRKQDNLMSQLKAAVERIKAGDRENGRKLLIEYLKKNPESELGWLWLASVTENLERQKQYLKRVLKLNPNNSHAHKRLNTLLERELLNDEPRFSDPPHKPQQSRPNTEHPKDPKKKRGCLQILVLIIGLFFMCAIISSMLDSEAGSPSGANGPTKTPSPDPFAAWVMCEQFVENQLVAPSTAEFGSFDRNNVDYLGNSEYLVLNYVDAQNSFGAVLRKTYLCKVRDNKDETWSLVDLQMD